MENKRPSYGHHEDAHTVKDKTVTQRGHVSEAPYGQKYPPGASSVEPHLDRGVQTDVETHRAYLKRQQEVYGDVLPSLNADRLEELLDVTKELLHTEKKRHQLNRSRVEMGKTYTFNITLAATAGVNRIDFVHQEPQYQRWTSGVSVNIPGHRLTQLQIFNDTGGVLAYQTNAEINSYEATNTLTSGQSKLIEFRYPVLESVNLVSTSGSCTTRLFMMW
jgi:hypothetical protein